MNALSPSRMRAALPVAALACVGGLALAACSSGASGTGVPAAPSGSASSSGAGGTQARNFGPRAAAQGEIAQISGRTLQVQSTTEQTAVTWSGSTSFSITKAAGRAAVTAGSCVVGIAATSGTSGSSASAPSAATSITATSVRISAPANGTCDAGGFGAGSGGGFGGGFGGRQGQRPSGAPTGIPSGFRRPSGFPSGGAGSGGFRGFGGVVTGKVTAVSGNRISVAMIRFARPSSTSGSPSAAPSPTTTSGTITVTASTTYTRTGPTAASSLAVGLCATVQGDTDTSGAVTARSIALSSPVNGSCTVSGFGGTGGH